MAWKVKKQISWRQDKKIIVVYYNFNYYFFKEPSSNWIKDILSNKKNQNIPEDFWLYLFKLGLIYEDSA